MVTGVVVVLVGGKTGEGLTPRSTPSMDCDCEGRGYRANDDDDDDDDCAYNEEGRSFERREADGGGGEEEERLAAKNGDVMDDDEEVFIDVFIVIGVGVGVGVRKGVAEVEKVIAERGGIVNLEVVCVKGEGLD